MSSTDDQDDQDDQKLILAIDIIIRDVDKKYDECLVEHFLDYIYDHSVDFPDSKFILDRLQTYFDHKAFVMMNQARAYKIFLAIVRDNESLFNELESYMDSFWSSIDIVILNDNLSAVTVMLSILEEMAISDEGIRWIFKKDLDPPIKIIKQSKEYELKYIWDVALYYLETCNNYHTKTKAEALLMTLIESSIYESSKLAIKMIMQEFLLNNVRSIVPVLSRVIKTNLKNLYKLKGLYGTLEPVHKTLMTVVDDCSSTELNGLCKCLALSNAMPSMRSEAEMHRINTEIIEMLQSKKKFEARTIYLLNLKHKDGDVKQASRTHNMVLYAILHPIYTQCQARNASLGFLGEGLEKFNASRLIKSPDTIDDRFITFNLVSLNSMLDEYLRKPFQEICLDDLRLIGRLIHEYIRLHMDDPASKYKSILECCNVFHKLTEVADEKFKSEILLNIYMHITSGYNFRTQQSQVILMNLLKPLQRPNMIHIQGTHLKQLIPMAASFENQQVINEYLVYFISSGVLDSIENMSDEIIKPMMDLVWLKLSKNPEFDDQDLLLNLNKTLDIMDAKLPANKLLEYDLEKGDTIPRYIAKNSHLTSVDVQDETGGDRVNRASLVDDILNYESIADGIMDCY